MLAGNGHAEARHTEAARRANGESDGTCTKEGYPLKTGQLGVGRVL